MQLARKITLPLALAAFFALGVSAWLSVQQAVELHHGDLERQQSVAGHVLVSALERARVAGNLPEVAAQLLEEANRERRTQMRLQPLDSAQLSVEERATLAKGETVFALDVWKTAETWIPTTLPDGTPGALWVRETLDEEREILNRIVWSHVLTFGTLGLLWAGVAIGLGAVVVGRPMRLLAEKARRVSTGDYSGPVQLKQRDEIGELAVEMNKMCDDLLAARNRLQQEITEREKAQEALRHADRLKTVGLLGAGIAHELGTPLNVVSMRARMIGTGEVQGEEIRSNADIIHEQAAQMTRIIRQLLDFARREPPRLMKFALDQVASQSLNILEHLAEKQNVKLVLEPSPRIDVEGNPTQVHQVITNLVMNAVQAMPQGGEVKVSLQTVRATPPADLGGPEGSYARVDVRDQGQGIAPEVLPHIFEPFFTTKPIGDGNGLGLAVAWGIVKDHRGWISVDSRVGAGSTFSFFLPLERETP